MNKINTLKELRIACGLSQRSLGQLFTPPINFGWLSHIEAGAKPFPVAQEPQIDGVIEKLSSIKDMYEKSGIQAINSRTNRGAKHK